MTAVEEGLQIIGINQGAKIRLSKNHKVAQIRFKCPICKKKSEVNLFCHNTQNALSVISINQYAKLICLNCKYGDVGYYVIDTQNQKFDKDEETKSFFKMRKVYKKLGWID